MKLNHISKSVIGLVRSANEDFIGDFTTKDNLRVYIVCDGMGGHVGGAKASQTAVNSIILCFLQEVKTCNKVVFHLNLQELILHLVDKQ